MVGLASGVNAETRRIAANNAKLSGLLHKQISLAGIYFFGIDLHQRQVAKDCMSAMRLISTAKL